MRAPAKIARDLRSLIRGEVFADARTRRRFSRDASIYEIAPACVVAPRSAQEVECVMQYAAENRVPLAPRGAGTGLAGESLTSGIVLDCTRHFRRILEIDAAKNWVRVQPGVVLATLNAALAKHGKRFGPDPASAPWCVVGGVLANNSTGAHSLRYGSARDHVLDLDYVLPNRAVDQTRLITALSANASLIERKRPRTRRNGCGYRLDGVCHGHRLDLPKLIVGSEGTLAIITEARLKVVDLPKRRALLLVSFQTLDAALHAVAPILTTEPAAVELLDSVLLGLARRRAKGIVPRGAKAVLYVEHDGDDLDERLGATERVCRGSAMEFRRAMDAQTQRTFWSVRSHAVPMIERIRSARKPVSFCEDTAVLPKDLPEYVAGVQRILARRGVTALYYAHAGDGELHIRPYLDLRTRRDRRLMECIACEVYELVWSLGGTISGEHADGLVRTQFIREQYGEKLYGVFREVKRAFDPLDILNPGKLVSDEPHLMLKHVSAKPARWRY